MLGDKMIAEQLEESMMEENKKRNASLAGLDRVSTGNTLLSPPSKKLKQCRLPFQTLAASPTNQQPLLQADQGANKRKRLVSDKSLESAQHNTVMSKADKTTPKGYENKSNIKLAKLSTSDAEVSSSSESSNIVLPYAVLLSTKHCVLDQFLRKTQQPVVSTSDGEEVIDLTACSTDDEDEVINLAACSTSEDDLQGVQNKVIEKESNLSNHNQPCCVDDTNSYQANGTPNSGEANPCTTPSLHGDCKDSIRTLVVAENCDSIIIDTPKRSKLIISKVPASSSPRVINGNGNRSPNIASPKAEGGEKAETIIITTPVVKGKTQRETPKSAMTLQREAERKQKQDERERLMKEKKDKQEEEKAEKNKLREEAKAAKEKERLEAKRLKELEKEKKENERQAKKQKEEEEKQEQLRKREEEKNRKQEILDAKLQEKKRKEEEKLKQDDEVKKSEEEKIMKKRKHEQAFRSFFTKAPESVAVKNEHSPNMKCGPFAPFELKKGMMLAPRVRREIDDVKKQDLQEYISHQNADASYLKDVKRDGFNPGKDRRTAPVSQTRHSKSKVSTDVKPDGEVVKCKFLYFHTNHRPAFYGTMKKRSKKINPRNPLSMDEGMLDYEVESDEEWEEPGESLSNSEGEDDAGSDDNDEDDDGFFVPHGYLSEDEGGSDRDEGIKKLKERQAAKIQAFEACLKKKIETLSAVVIGPLWAGNDKDTQSEHWKLLEQYTAVILVNTPIQTTWSEKVSPDSDADVVLTELSKYGVKKSVPEEAMPDLIRLVHGNTAGIKSLSRSFREFWDQKNDAVATSDVQQDSRRPVTPKLLGDIPAAVNMDNVARPGTPVGESPCELSISARQIKLKITKIAVREKRIGYDRDCWYVHADLLEKYALQSLPVPNVVVQAKKSKIVDASTTVQTPKVNRIGLFAQKLSPEAYQKQAQKDMAVLKAKQEKEKAKKEQERAIQKNLLEQHMLKRLEQQRQLNTSIMQMCPRIPSVVVKRFAFPPTAGKLVPNVKQPYFNSIPPSVIHFPQQYCNTIPASMGHFATPLNHSKPKATVAVASTVKSRHTPLNQTQSKGTNVFELLARRPASNVIASHVAGESKQVDQSKVCGVQKMEVDCGYTADSEG